MKKRIKYILIVLIIIILLLIVICISTRKHPQNVEIDKEVSDVVEVITNEEITYEEFVKLIGKKVPNVNIAVGPNSYLRNKPNKDVIKKYKLEEYVKLQDELASKVEKKYIEHLKVESVQEDVREDHACYYLRVTSFFYALYLNDFINLTNAQLDVDVSDIVGHPKQQAEYLKKEVMTLKILDNHLDYYDNDNNDVFITRICYKNQKIENSSMMLSLVLALQGNGYPNVDFSNKKNQQLSQERLQQYLKEVETTTLFE